MSDNDQNGNAPAVSERAKQAGTRLAESVKRAARAGGRLHREGSALFTVIGAAALSVFRPTARVVEGAALMYDAAATMSDFVATRWGILAQAIAQSDFIAKVEADVDASADDVLTLEEVADVGATVQAAISIDLAEDSEPEGSA